MGAGIFVVFTITIVTLIMVGGLLLYTIKHGTDSIYFLALKSGFVCAVSAFIFTVASSNEPEILKSLLLTVNPSIIIGSIWLGGMYVIFSTLIDNDLLCVSSKLKLRANEVWLFGILPSLIFLGYVVSEFSKPSNHFVSLWWLKGFFVVVTGLMLLLVGRLIGLKVIESIERKTQRITIATSPLLWLPIVILVLLLSLKLWIQ